jgi:hypothetical protein
MSRKPLAASSNRRAASAIEDSTSRGERHQRSPHIDTILRSPKGATRRKRHPARGTSAIRVSGRGTRRSTCSRHARAFDMRARLLCAVLDGDGAFDMRACYARR